MHFAKTEKGHSKLTRVCSLLLSFLIVCSVLFVGNIGKIEASAANISSGTKITIRDNTSTQWWRSSTRFTYVIWWTTGGESSKKMKKEASDKTFTFPEDCDYFIVLRMDNSSYSYSTDSATGAYNVGSWPSSSNVKNQTVTVNFALNNSTLQIDDGQQTDNQGKLLQEVSWTNISYTSSLGQKVTAKNNFGDSYGSGSDKVDLVAVPAVFYDYFTDYEVVNGWRSIVTTTDNRDASTAISDNKNVLASRTYESSFPFTAVNKYISDLSGENWQLPLYFGNFFTGNSLQYQTGARKIYFGNDGYQNKAKPQNDFSLAELKNFSSQANNSMFMKDTLNDWSKGSTDAQTVNDSVIGYSDASKSFLGLVNDTLEGTNGDTLTMGNTINAPYFTDAIVDAGLAAKVTTDFPMRVETKQSNKFLNSTTGAYDQSGEYKTYVFNSLDGEDNVYFKNYGESDFNVNYAHNDHSVYDALGGFGGTQNNKGFFPFDDADISANNDVAYDYGFGMRLDIPFTVGKNGFVEGSQEPVTFGFSGDDDVWVFIDGKLALDIGGDHKMAQGSINFAEKTATITSGVYQPGTYGANHYSNPTTTSSTKSYDLSYSTESVNLDGGGSTNYYTADLSSILTYDDSSSTWYDPSNTHTLTVFYMERGMSESNLSLEFTLSPLQNQLTVDKDIDLTDVNENLQSAVQTQANNDKFDYLVKVGNSSTSTSATWYYSYNGASGTTAPQYTDLNGENGAALGSDGKVTGITNGNGFMFKEQINDDGSKWVDITETAQSGNKYTYTPYMKYTDVSNNTGTDLSQTNNVNFKFQTASTKQGAVTNFAVHNVNKIKTGKITLKKTYASNSDFNFTVKVKVPGASDYVTLGTYTVTANAASGNPEITGIPLGSEVVITENVSADDYTTAYVIGTGSSQNGSEATINSLSEDTTVTFTNTDVVHTVSATVEASKTLDGEPSTEAFNFSLTPLTESSGKYTTSGDALTASNGTSGANVGKIKFEIPSLNKGSVYYYLLKETSTDSTTRHCDDKVYIVKIDTTGDTPSVSYYNASKSGSEYTLGTAVTSVTFANTTIPQYGSVKVTKKGSNNELLEHVIIALVKAENKGTTEEPDWQPKSGAAETTKETTCYGIAQFDNVEPGEYVIYEKRSVSQYNADTSRTEGYELYGKYVHITVTENHETTFEMIDPVSTDLPKTGGAGVLALVVVGVILVSVGVYLLRPSKKKETK